MNSFRRIFHLIKNYRKNLVLGIICNILTALFTVVSIPFVIPFFQILFDREPTQENQILTNNWEPVASLQHFFSSIIENNSQEKALLIVCGLILGAYLGKNIFRYLALFFLAPMRTGVMYDLRQKLHSSYLNLPLSFYSDEKKGDLISRVASDVQEVEWGILHVIESIFKSPLIIIGSVAIMLYISPQLSLFVMVLLAFTALIIGTVSRKLRRQSSEAQTYLGQLISTAEESISSLRIIKAFNSENYQEAKFKKENTAFRKKLTHILWRKDLSSPLSEFLGIAVVAVLLWYGSKMVFGDQLEPESFFAFIFAFYQVIEPSKAFSTAYYNIQKGMAALDRIDEVANDSLLSDTIQKAEKNASFTQSIQFRELSFKYEEDNDWAIKDLNLEINKGETLALVGESGAGKSTLIDLLIGFYSPTRGSILMDGINIEKINSKSLRSLFAMVTQDALLFHDTIANNILFGYQATEEEMIKAAKMANAHDFISAFPKGYQTLIGDQGMKLSGGQKQRLTLARAILRNPEILILDEATSALDSQAEVEIQKALAHILENRTAIVIAHRLSTIKSADRIVVLEKGQITESGSHEALIKAGGPYQKYATMQFFNPTD